jgi:glycosyltransferase involved in cell wall biosynthesis
VTPRISVIIPVYNGAATIRRALDSVAAQSYPPAEIVVVDDGSTDGTAEIVERHAGPIRLLRQQNQGVSVARNRGAAEATGDWLAFLDADDLYFPDRLKWHADWIADDPNLDFLTGDQEYRQPNGTVLRTHMINTAAGRMLLEKAGGAIRVVMDRGPEFRAFVAAHFGDTHTLTVRRETLLELGGYPVGRAVCEDVSLLIRLLARSRRVGVITRPMAAYYLYPTSATRCDPVRAQQETVAALTLLRRDLAAREPSIRAGLDDAIASARFDHAVALLRGGRRADALRAIWPNFTEHPSLASARQLLAVWRGLSSTA